MNKAEIYQHSLNNLVSGKGTITDITILQDLINTTKVRPPINNHCCRACGHDLPYISGFTYAGNYCPICAQRLKEYPEER